MNDEDYRRFYDQTGLRNGWDFSSVRYKIEGGHESLYEEAVKLGSRLALWLDIGTGGGEAVLPYADTALLLIGIDRSASMVQTALENGRKSGRDNVRFIEMDGKRLDFPDRFFDLITCRHSGFCAREAARVLRPGGYFLTQQVSERDKWNLKQAFGRGQSMDEEDGALLLRYRQELAEAGFREIQCVEWDAIEFYESHEDLLFLLRFTPIIPCFGQEKEDFKQLGQFIREHTTEQGIRTNAKRFMLIAQK